MQLFTYLAPAGQALLPYLSEISIALVACTLVMLGGEINAFCVEHYGINIFWCAR